MRIRFSLAWFKPGQAPVKAFKSSAAFSLVREYTERIGHFLPCEAGAYPSRAKSCVWVCERGKRSKTVSSEELARELQKCMNSGAQALEIVIGGPDGFTEEALDEMKPVFRWSFGPMTLPHELAAVVATEQIYRAFTILHHQPYHSGH
jgi:23S rRNA (pseudouridine1915-N3)-methyltransferase